MNIDLVKRFTTNVPTRLDKEWVVHELVKGNELTFSQPCNCKDNILHNNGGNYHYCVKLRLVDNVVVLNWTTTSELEIGWFFEYEEIPVYELVEFLEKLENSGFKVVG